MRPRGFDKWEDLVLLDPLTQHLVLMFFEDVRHLTRLEKINPDLVPDQAKLDELRSMIERMKAGGDKVASDSPTAWTETRLPPFTS
jgi:hypothetical protein